MAWLCEVDCPTVLERRFEDVVVSAMGVSDTMARARQAGRSSLRAGQHGLQPGAVECPVGLERGPRRRLGVRPR